MSLSLKVYKIERSLVKKNEPVLYYMKDGPLRGFVREELMIVSHKKKYGVTGLVFKIDAIDGKKWVKFVAG